MKREIVGAGIAVLIIGLLFILIGIWLFNDSSDYNHNSAVGLTLMVIGTIMIIPSLIILIRHLYTQTKNEILENIKPPVEKK